MKKIVFMFLAMVLGLSVMAQQKIQLRSADKAECLKSDMKSLKASFSFSTIEAENVDTPRGLFSWLSMSNTVIGGNVGDPQIPVVNELIAVPFGANPRIEITNYNITDYRLEDYGIHTLVPHQLSLRKDQKPEDVPFVYNANAYQTRGLRSEPQAFVSVVGTMRGVQLGKMTIEPVSYDPVNNTLRVFNNIEVEVSFDGADAVTTEKMLVDTYSPYFDIIYKQLFNGRSIRSIYDQHPDLYTTPVKMLVVTTSTYANSTAFQNWLIWKKQKGIDVDVQTVNSGANATTIKNMIYARYNANHPTFLVIVGDETVVTYYQLWNYNSTYGNAATDLEYASVDGDVYHDMFISRMSVSSTTELDNLVNKILTYEKYTMSDPSYLNETLLIAGWDSYWTNVIGKPTIQYANNNYFNSAHGITPHVFITTGTNQTTCYNYINNVGFINYTAHGDIQEWSNPEFTNTNVNSLTNNDKYFWAMGNCCLTCNFKNVQNNLTCFGEAMIRAANKGAFGYIGSVPETYWFEDFYFGVGAFAAVQGTNNPTVSGTTTGCYDAMFDDTGFNTLNSVPFIGNLAVSYAHAANYNGSVSDEYYWRAYQCFGDGSVMPYIKEPAANNVSHANTISVGSTTFTVSAVAGSYVAITKNNEILGVAQVPSSGTINVPIIGLASPGDVMVVVTRQQRQPYITTIQAISADGPYITLDSYTPNKALINENTDLSLTFKNVGIAATSGTTTVTLSSIDSNVTIVSSTKTFNALAPNDTTMVSGFQIRLNSGVTLGSNVILHYTAVNGSNTWEGDFSITPNQIFTVNVAANNTEYGTVSGGGQFNYGESCTITATPTDNYVFLGWTQNGEMVSGTASYTFNVTSDMYLMGHFGWSVMIGDGGTATSNYLPSYNYYNYSLSQQIYTAGELDAPGIISSIAFYNSGAQKIRNYDFYMKHTTKSSFSNNTDWIAVSASDKVFSGSVTMAPNDWTVINFDTPFVFDGTSNIVFVADDNTGEWTSSPHMTCQVFNATSQAIYVYNDNTNYNPYTPSSYNGTVLSVKNQIIFGIEEEADTYVISAIANPTEGGTVSGGDNYEEGYTCTLTATANSDYTFINWTEDGVVVSTEATYSFIVTRDRSLVANFVEGDLCAITFDLYDSYGDGWNGNQLVVTPDNWNPYVLTLEDGSSSTQTLMFVSGSHITLTWIEGGWTNECSFMVSYSNGDVIYYGEDMNDEFMYEFDVNCNGSMAVTQVSNFAQGYNWWSTYIEQEDIDGLGILEEGLDNNGVSIRSQASGYTDYYGNYGWYGSLTSINNESSYRVITSAPCTVTMTGSIAEPLEHPITVSQGWTWIGYVPSVAMDVNAVMEGMDATQGDKLKSQQGYAEFYPSYGWYGSLNTIEPGMGLMYYSVNSEDVTFIYPYNYRSGKLKANLTSETNHWKPNTYAYPDNMTVMAVVKLDDLELTSTNYELAAFAENGECRGSVKLTYAEPLHRHVAFLTVSGKDAAELSFRLYDTETGKEYYDAEESIDFVANAIVGEANDLYVVHFRGTTGMDEFANRVRVYPNPVNRGEQFSIGLFGDVTIPVRVEIINTLGVVETVCTSSLQDLTAPNIAGVYTLRITMEGERTCIRKLVVK